MLLREIIWRYYHRGPDVIIELIEQQYGADAFNPAPLPAHRQSVIEELSRKLDSLQTRAKQLEDELTHQRYITRKQNERIAELETQLSLPVKDSHNSSLAPSTDGPAVKRTRSLRQATGRKPGAQAGHVGRTRRLANDVDEVVRYEPDECKHCKTSLATSEALRDEKRQVIELPEIKLRVVEHRAVVKRCSKCGRATKASFPKEVSATLQYGARLQAVAVYLLEYQLLPYERTCKLMREMFGCEIAPGALSNIVSKCWRNLSKTEAQIRGALLRSDVMHVDETGLRVGKKLKYVHVASTAKLTYLSTHPNRGRRAINEIAIVPNYAGTLVHDGFLSYNGYGNCSHSLCCAHILRELIYLIEASQKQKQWADPMKQLLLEIKAAVDEAKAAGKQKLTASRGGDSTSDIKKGACWDGR